MAYLLYLQVQSKERKILNLQGEITELTNQLALRESENTNHITSINILQEQHRESSKQVSSSVLCFLLMQMNEISCSWLGENFFVKRSFRLNLDYLDSCVIFG